MNFLRIGEKVISKTKIDDIIKEILEFRQAGYSQSEVARKLSIDRTLVSRIENIGEVRKGRSIAVIGFPIANKEELETVLNSLGVDYSIILSDEERWNFVSEKTGLDLFNSIMEIVAHLHNYDNVVVIGSNKRIKIVEAVMDKEVVGFEIGESPIRENKWVDIDKVKELIHIIR